MSLKDVQMFGTMVTQQGVRALQRRHPEVNIGWKPEMIRAHAARPAFTEQAASCSFTEQAEQAVAQRQSVRLSDNRVHTVLFRKRRLEDDNKESQEQDTPTQRIK